MNKRSVIIMAIVFVVLLAGIAAFMFWPRPAQSPAPSNSADVSNAAVSNAVNAGSNQSNASNDTVSPGSTLVQNIASNEAPAENAAVEQPQSQPQTPPAPVTPETASSPRASDVYEDRAKSGVNLFLASLYDYDADKVSSHRHERYLRSSIAYDALSRDGMLLPVREHLSSEWMAMVVDNPTFSCTFDDIIDFQVLDAVHDGVHDHMAATRVAFVVTRNAGRPGEAGWERLVRQRVTADVYLDSEYRVADFIETGASPF